MKLFLTGGFLGSGKTTAIREACAVLLQDRTRAAVITNDQGQQLVDTEFIKANDILMWVRFVGLPVTAFQHD